MKLIKLKKNKGQAAMTDSLFFLTIIVALCVLLFRFSSVYGERIDLAVDNLYFKEYTNSTLKTIFYTDIPLNFDKDLEDSLEVDYLITAIKSDFLQNGKIGPGISNLTDLDNEDDRYIPKYNLFHTIKSLLYPIPNYDYLFYFFNVNNEEFIYFMLKINELDNIENPTSIESRYYLCDPYDMSAVRNVVQRSNKLYSSSTPVIFKTRGTGDATIEINGVANLTMWASTSAINHDLITTNLDIDYNDYEDYIDDTFNLNCTQINSN